MADNDYDTSANESGIRKFFRGILPQWPPCSSQQGAADVQSNLSKYPADREETPSEMRPKRKSSLLTNTEEDTEESDLEDLPSCKRQRITVSAMQRLFAKFTLSDTDTTSAPQITTQAKGEIITRTVSAENIPTNFSNKSQKDNISASKTLKVLQISTKEQQDISKKTKTKKNNNKKDIPNRNNIVSNATTVIKNNSTTKLSGNKNKRQAEHSDNDEPSTDTRSPKMKKTRTLKRGLRLCSNITCYIEQVIYG